MRTPKRNFAILGLILIVASLLTSTIMAQTSVTIEHTHVTTQDNTQANLVFVRPAPVRTFVANTACRAAIVRQNIADNRTTRLTNAACRTQNRATYFSTQTYYPSNVVPIKVYYPARVFTSVFGACNRGCVNCTCPNCACPDCGSNTSMIAPLIEEHVPTSRVMETPQPMEVLPTPAG